MSNLPKDICYERYLKNSSSSNNLLLDLEDCNGKTEGIGMPTKKTYDKRKGTSIKESLKGFEYEFRTMIWLLICALRNSSIGSFYVSSNEDGCGCFDDIIMRCKYSNTSGDVKTKRYFIQTKIKKRKGNTINRGHISSVKGSFSSQKYFSSLNEIKKNESTTKNNRNKIDDTFILYTNAKLDDFKNEFNKLEEFDLDSILCKDFNTGCIFSIKDDCSGRNNDVPLLLFSSQDNLDEINCRIREGIADIFKCSMNRANYIFLNFCTKILPCYESTYFLTKNIAWKLLHESERIVFNHLKNEFNYMNMNLSGEDTPDEESQHYMKQAVKRTLSQSDLECLSNFDSDDSLITLSKNLSKFKTEGTCNRVKNVYRPSKDLNIYYTALWFYYNFHSNREFLLRKLFLPGFQSIRKAFNLILADGLKLHSAILQNDIGKINHLVCDNVDVNVQDKGGRTPLHLVPFLSSDTDQKYVTKLLLKHGACISIVDKIFSWNALRYADATHSWSTIALILNHGGCINDLLYTMHTDGANALYCALNVGSKRFVQFLVENGIDVNTVITTDGEMPLHIAATYGSLEIVKFLVENKANINVCDVNGNRAIYLALLNKHTAIYQYLQSNGALQLNQ